VTTAMAAFPPCRHKPAPASGCSAPNLSALPDACAARTRPALSSRDRLCRPVSRPTGKHAKSDLMAGLPSRVYASATGHAPFRYLGREGLQRRVPSASGISLYRGRPRPAWSCYREDIPKSSRLSLWNCGRIEASESIQTRDIPTVFWLVTAFSGSGLHPHLTPYVCHQACSKHQHPGLWTCVIRQSGETANKRRHIQALLSPPVIQVCEEG
jgi:hypothetical protein